MDNGKQLEKILEVLAQQFYAVLGSGINSLWNNWSLE